MMYLMRDIICLEQKTKNQDLKPSYVFTIALKMFS